MDIISMSALELAEAIRSGKVTAPEAMEAVWQQIEQKEEKYHCYITVSKEKAMERARQVQNKIEKEGFAGMLAGVPIAVKDNLCTKGIPTTCGSRMLADFVPEYTAEAVKRLCEAGAVVVGKTNMDEFAMGSTTETSAFGVTRNPWNFWHVPGGSSGGSGAAVAAKECFFALGTDTGGSVRQPAAHCGIVGLKPTYGTVSRYGMVAYGSSLEQIGPMTKDVADCAGIFQVLAGQDRKDSTSVQHRETDFTSALFQGVKGMKIGIPEEYLENNAEEIGEAVMAAAEVLKEQGAKVETFSLKNAEYVVPDYYLLASAEASSNLSRFDGVKYGYRSPEYEGLHDMYKKTRTESFGKEVKRRILLGTFALSAGYYEDYYLRALQVRELIKQSFREAFQKYDILLGPVAPTTAPKLGENLSDPLRMYQSDCYTVAANLTGTPAISVPFGFDKKGLPIGVQLMADAFQEKKLFQAAYTLEGAI